MPNITWLNTYNPHKPLIRRMDRYKKGTWGALFKMDEPIGLSACLGTSPSDVLTNLTKLLPRKLKAIQSDDAEA